MAITSAMCTSFKTELLDGVHAFGTAVVRASTDADVFKVALYTADAVLGASTTEYTTTDEVVGSGYTAGGVTIVPTTPSSGGTTAFVNFSDATWASASLTARGALIYNSTQGNKAVAVLVFGEDKTSSGGDFVITFPENAAGTAAVRLA